MVYNSAPLQMGAQPKVTACFIEFLNHIVVVHKDRASLLTRLGDRQIFFHKPLYSLRRSVTTAEIFRSFWIFSGIQGPLIWRISGPAFYTQSQSSLRQPTKANEALAHQTPSNPPRASSIHA